MSVKQHLGSQSDMNNKHKQKGKPILPFRSEEKALNATCYTIIFKVAHMKQHIKDEQHSFKTTNTLKR